MLTLRDLMTPAPVTIASGATLREAVEALTAAGVNALPVVDGDRVAGLISAQGIVAFEATTPGVPAAGDGDEEFGADSSPDAVERGIPAVEYFVDLRDDAGTDIVERFHSSEAPEWDVLAEHTVDEAMNPSPPRLPPSATVYNAASLMRLTGSHGVLVTLRGKLLGIVTTMDITRAFGGKARRSSGAHGSVDPSAR